MQKITIAVRRTVEVSQTIEVSDAVLAKLMNGDNPFYDEMQKKLDSGEGETALDYAVLDEDGENYIVPWS